MQLYPVCFWSCLSSVRHLPYVFRRRSTGFPSSCSAPYSWEWVMLFLSAEATFKPGGSLIWEFTSENLSQLLVLCRPSLAHEGNGYPIFRAELSVGIISIYGVGSHASYPNAHKLLLHTDTVLKAYTLIERLERDVLDERYSVYLYVVDFCTELNGLCFLTSYDGTYIMTVNAHNTVIDLPAFKHFLFLYKTFPTMESRFW